MERSRIVVRVVRVVRAGRGVIREGGWREQSQQV